MMNNLQSSAFVAKTTQLLSSVAHLRLMFVMLLTLTASTAWGATANHTCSGTSGTIVSSKITFTTTSATWNSPQCRIAANGSITFTLTGVRVTKIAMGFSSSGYVGKWTSSGGGSFSTNSTTVTWTGSANPGTLTFTTSSAARLKTISVTYETATTTYSVTYDLNGGTGTIPTQANVAAGGKFTLAASSGFSNAGYSFAGWNDGTTTYNAGATYTMPAKAVTLKAQWTALPKYTVNWYVNGSKAYSQTDVAGTALTNIPNLEDYECEDKVFVGWTTQPSYEHATNAPTDLITNTSGLTMPENGKDYYAVFAEASGDGEDGWQKVTSTDQVKDGEMYAFISFDEAYYLANALSTSDPIVKTVSKTNGILNVTDEMKWIASANSGGFEFKSYSNNDYYLWGGSANDAIRINTTSTKANATKVWYTKILNTYGVVIYHNASTDGAKYLATNGSSNWRNYLDNGTLGNTNRVANLYKFTSGTTYSNYTTSCTTETVLSLRPQPAYRHSVKNLLFCKFHHINMSKITLLVCAFACKQLTNFL